MVYGHLATKIVDSPPTNSSEIIDTVWYPGLLTQDFYFIVKVIRILKSILIDDPCVERFILRSWRFKTILS